MNKQPLETMTLEQLSAEAVRLDERYNRAVAYATDKQKEYNEAAATVETLRKQRAALMDLISTLE